MTRKSPGAGHIRERLTSTGESRFEVLVKEEKKQRTLKGGLRSRMEAEAYLAAYHVERAEAGFFVPNDTGILTFRKLGVLYLAGISERTRRTEERRWRARIEPAEFIDWPVTQLGEPAARRWIDTMARTEIATGKAKGKRPSRGTLATALSTLRAALRFAVIHGHVDTNVADRVTIRSSTMAAPKGTAAGDGFDYLREPEVRRILSAEELLPRARTAFVLLAFTGARPMDLYRLDWSNVDVPAATVQYWSHKRDRHYTVHLLPVALDVMRSWWLASGRPATGLVFPGDDGKAHVAGYDWGWPDKKERAHYTWVVDGETRKHKSAEVIVRPGWRTKIGIHRPLALYSLRHTCASHLLLGTPLFTGGTQWSLEQVASQLGHADMSTVRRYAVALGLASKSAVEASRIAIKASKNS